MKSTPQVNFIKVGGKVQIIQISLSIFALRLRPTFEKLFTGIKVQPKGVGAQKKFYEIDPSHKKLCSPLLKPSMSKSIIRWYHMTMSHANKYSQTIVIVPFVLQVLF